MHANSSVLDHDLPAPTERSRRGISIVWIIPLVAALIAAWLAYTTLAEKGPTITIEFKTAQGLEAGKTKVKYKDVEVGHVTDVRLADNLSHIIVTAEMVKGAEPYMNDGTRFWIVRPRIGVGGISGLSTLVSGAHVEVDPGEGDAIGTFVGLEEPPLVGSDVAGREFVLRAERLGSVSRGSPIHYRGLEVGEILGIELDVDGQGVTFHAFVEAPYDMLVSEQTRFWNVSGIDFELGANGVSLSTGSLQSMLIGGIAFDTPVTAEVNRPAEAGTAFALFDNLKSISEAAFTETVPYLVHFEGSVRGLHVGAPVEFRGMKVGQVTDIRLVYDTEADSLDIPVVIGIEPERVGIVGDVAFDTADEHAVMAHLIEQGLRAQLASGSLLTGELLVSLDFHDDQTVAALNYDQHHPEIPTVPSDLEGLTRSVSDVVNQIAALPIEDIGADIKHILESVDALVSSPETQQSPTSLKGALDDVRDLIAKVDGQTGPLMAALLNALESADLTLNQATATLTSAENMVGEGSQVRFGLDNTLTEISGAARSIRIFADYLERHPEALIRGK